MTRLIINRFNIIVNFLIEIENYNIIVLLKSDSDDELAENDII